VRPAPIALALCLVAACEDTTFPCPAARVTFDGGCARISDRCSWPIDAGVVHTCTCAGSGEARQWACHDFRTVNDAGCPSAAPANGEACDTPTAQACILPAPDGCRFRCECVPMVGVVTPPRWTCTRFCPSDAAVRDAPAG
jgi:hypothetical protein